MKRLLAGLLALAAVACGEAPDPSVTVLTYGSPYSPGHPFSRADRIWMDHVEDASGGEIVVKPYWGGGLLSSEESMLEVRHGVVDIGLITPIYARGGAHLLRAQAGFYGGVTSYEDQLALYDCMSSAFTQFGDETHGLKVLAVQGGNLPGVITRERPVRTIEDFRGLRIRAPVELLPLLEQLGADPISLPMGEVYSAMAKGVIDGVAAPADTFQSLHFDEVARYMSAVRFPRGAYPSRAMSLKVWDRLREDQRALLGASIVIWEEAMREQITGAEARGEAYGREQGVEFTVFDAGDQARLNELYNDAARAAARRLKLADGNAEPIFEGARVFADDPRRGACVVD